jgi:hypothetical protein
MFVPLQHTSDDMLLLCANFLHTKYHFPYVDDVFLSFNNFSPAAIHLLKALAPKVRRLDISLDWVGEYPQASLSDTFR